jgi:Fe-S-cluster containining protein
MNTFQIDLSNLTNDKIEALIHNLRKSQLSLDLGIRADKDGVNYFSSKFRCIRCGKCCDGTIIGPRGEKYVRLSELDFKRLKQHMKAKKLRRLCIEIDNRERGLPLPCPFLIREPRPACKIYDTCPDICRLYPLELQELNNPDGPPTIKVDPYCESACNLFRSLIIAESNKYKALTDGSKKE